MNVAEQSAKSIFLHAIENYTPDRWQEYLDEACATDTGLRYRVEALLRSHQESDRILDQSVASIDDAELDDMLGTTIASYKLVQKIGEGGFGVVYMAEQQEPVRRTVALKIIKPGTDTKQVIARFEAERQALALMDHPNIARVLDAGTTSSRRPYFVMDLVKGIPITDYCDKNNLDTTARLRLFATVCKALQHAHQKGIIHRDLKPANIMVTLHDGKPVPKIIDFGVSKAISQQLTEKTLLTAYGQMIGTPQYMSPEQAEMSSLDIDTRSDVYSLGVLLYELLTGKAPLERERLRQAGYAEMQRLVCEEEPPRPSAKLSTLGNELTTIAEHRSVAPDRLRQILNGDLDWIVMKALEKERGRRYDSASRFSDDVERFLRDEPVDARPPSAAYVLRKFVRRNKGPVVAGLAVATALIAGVIGTTIGLIRAEQAYLLADAEARRANKAADDEKQAKFLAEQLQDEAEQEAERFRRLSYVSDMHAALHVWQTGDVGRAAELLKRHMPNEGKEDLRGFEWYYLFALCKRSLMTPTYECSADSLSCSADDARLFFGEGRLVKLLDLRTLQATDFAGHDSRVIDVAYSPNREMVASSGNAGEIFLWHTDSGSLHLSLRHRGRIDSLAFSEDGALLASSSWHAHNAKIWDVKTGRELATIQHRRPVTSVAFSNDGSFLASCDWEGTVKLTNAKNGEEQSIVAAHSGPSTCLAFSPKSPELVSAGADSSVRLWSIMGGELKPLGALNGHVGSVAAVAYSLDGKRLASSGIDKTVRLWNVLTREEVDTLRGTATALDLAFMADDKTLAVAGRDGIKLWNVFQRPAPDVLRGPTGEVCRPVFPLIGER